MKNRKLRIGWSVAWGIVAVLFIALWVRSYTSTEAIFGGIGSTRELHVSPSWGLLWLSIDDSPGQDHPWRVVNEPLDEPGREIERDISHKIAALGFASARTNSGCLVIMPLWLPFISIVALATAPWIQWSKRFTLRTLLIATTLVAVGLGLIVWAAK